MRTIGGLRVDELVGATIRTGETSSCEIDVTQFGKSAERRWLVFTAFLADLARDGLHVDYQACWDLMMDMPVGERLLRKLPGQITRRMSHDLGPTVIKMTFRRMPIAGDLVAREEQSPILMPGMGPLAPSSVS